MLITENINEYDDLDDPVNKFCYIFAQKYQMLCLMYITQDPLFSISFIDAVFRSACIFTFIFSPCCYVRCACYHCCRIFRIRRSISDRYRSASKEYSSSLFLLLSTREVREITVFSVDLWTRLRWRIYPVIVEGNFWRGIVKWNTYFNVKILVF